MLSQLSTMTTSRRPTLIPLLAAGLLLVATLVAPPRARAAGDPSPAKKRAEKPTEEQAAKSLDDDLFPDLDAELMRDVDAGKRTKPARPVVVPGDQPPPLPPDPTADDSTDPKAPDDQRSLDQRLLEALEQGEDAGEESPLLRAGRRMREAQTRIAESRADQATLELQEEIIRDLEAMIDEAKKRSKGKPQGSSKSSSQSRRSQAEQPQPKPQERPGENQGDGGESTQPARESSDELRPDIIAQAQLEEAQALMKDLWGHLPAQVREQMLQSSVEQFLPKYQVLIEQYFRRLIDEQAKPPR